ncbi:hypothetical protein [Scytonema sp. PRP1]|uniref:hypothetical protein n=1 Tax=Scytonema sp. PRP1 TaxID=3120513 RepID=UPI002FD34EB4
MKAITRIATVTTDGKITVQLPPDIPAGEHQIVVVIDEKPVTRFSKIQNYQFKIQNLRPPNFS